MNSIHSMTLLRSRERCGKGELAVRACYVCCMDEVNIGVAMRIA